MTTEPFYQFKSVKFGRCDRTDKNLKVQLFLTLIVLVFLNHKASIV